ncbi:hypothetical protein WJX72_000879 [[Myrmecia] bisecta]|uniref:NADPH oxidase n=1 Tax=[Myrmecia] bisecta TaxID=41462 RepID=A0AAW1P6U1_9CHLO
MTEKGNGVPKNELVSFESLFQEKRTAPAKLSSPANGPRLVSRPLASLGFKSFLPTKDEAAEFAAEKALLLDNFKNLRGGRAHIQLQSFKNVVQVGGDAFAERLFAVMEGDKNGYVTADTLVTKLLTLQRGTVRDRINFVFDILDTKRTGLLTADQVATMLKISCKESNIRADDAMISDLTNDFFRKAGKRRDETISRAEFAGLLISHEELLKSIKLIIKVDGRTLDVKKGDESKEVKEAVKKLPWYERAAAVAYQKFKVENPAYDFWVLIFTLGQIAGFVVRFLQNYHAPTEALAGWSYPIAKGSAGAIQVLMILIFFPIARSLLTLLRTTPLRHVVPVDDNLSMHRFIAYCLAFWSAMHTIAHLNNANNIGDSSRVALWHAIPGNANKPQPTLAQFYGQETQVTGVLLCAAMLMGYLFAVPWPRTSRWIKGTGPPPAPQPARPMAAIGRVLNNFNAFFWTHRMMAFLMVVLLLLHPYPGPVAPPKPHRSTTWVYMIPGVVFLLLERLIRRLRQAFWSTDIVGARLLPGDVTELKLQKPAWARGGFVRPFNYKPGQYCFLMMPGLSRMQWHPFSITSAPSDPYVSFHIRAAGDWTKALRELMKTTIEAHVAKGGSTELDAAEKGVPLAQVSKGSAQVTSDPDEGNEPLLPWAGAPTVYLDGPYGAPAQDIEDFEVLLLVGGGIGVTPLASVIRTLVKDFENACCKVCKTPHASLFKPKKVYFYWTVQEQTAPTYFKQTLEAVTKQYNCADFLEMHIHLTRVLPENDLRVTLARVAQTLAHEGDGRDPFSGVEGLLTEFGRPNWNQVFKNIKDKHKGALVGVFVCGPAALSAQIKGLCAMHSDSARGKEERARLTEDGTLFAFHKENF